MNGSMKATTIDLIRRARQLERETISALTPEQRDRVGTKETWSTKDKLIHVNMWKLETAQHYNHPAAGRDPNRDETFQEHNDFIFEQTHRFSWAEAAQYADNATDAMIVALEAYPEEQVSQPHLFEWLGDHSLAEHTVSGCVWHALMHMSESYVERGDGEGALKMLNSIAKDALVVIPSERALATAKYNQACIYAQIGDSSTALPLLAAALAERPDLKEWAPQDSDLATLHHMHEFKALIA